MNQSRVIIIGGLPGTGKSTLAKRLSRELCVAAFSKDELESAILRCGGGSEEGLKGAGYEQLREIALVKMANNRSVILDCIAPARHVHDFWSEMLKRPFAYIECVCTDSALLKERIDSNTTLMPGLAKRTWDDYVEAEASYSPFSEDRLVLDSVLSVEHNLSKALQYLNSTGH